MPTPDGYLLGVQTDRLTHALHVPDGGGHMLCGQPIDRARSSRLLDVHEADRLMAQAHRDGKPTCHTCRVHLAATAALTDAPSPAAVLPYLP